jgi:hypothetical protein
MLLHPGSELQQFEQAARQLSHSEKDITTSVTLFGLTSLRILHDTIEATQRNEERVVYTIGALVSRECLRMAIGKANLPSQIR